jgi:peptidoglycan/LPS O-acetylase OafA/YrhL
MRFLGRISFSIYLFHYPIYLYCYDNVKLLDVVQRYSGDPSPFDTVFDTGLIYFGFVLIITYMVTRFYDEPMGKLLKKINGRTFLKNAEFVGRKGLALTIGRAV